MLKLFLKKIKMWIIAIFGVGVVLAAGSPLLFNDTVQPLAISKDKIIYYKVVDEKKLGLTGLENIGQKHVKYYYQVEDPPKQNEILELRTRNSKTFLIGEDNQYRLEISLGLPYEKINNKWYVLQNSTTTIDNYNKHFSLNLVAYFIHTALATTVNEQVTASTDDAEQNTAASSANLVAVNQYIGDNSGSGTWTFGARFASLAVPNSATINSASISVKATWAGDGGVQTKIYAEDVDDCVTHTTALGPTDKLASKTTAGVDWDPGAFIEDVFNSSPDISTVIQEIVNRGSWSTGNDICILVTDDSGGNWSVKEIYTYDSAAANAPKMVIDYTSAPPSNTCTYSGSGDWYIDSDDDCYITSDVYVSGETHLLNRGSGGLSIINGAKLYTAKFNSTSTPVYLDKDNGSTIGKF